MSGVFQGDGYCQLRDIFGIFSFSCGLPHNRTIKIRSAPCLGKEIRINAQSGAEDRRSKPSVDEKRYYMREYTPGDRIRDINWKSSDKIDTLITRISMDNQEKINRIEIHFRNYKSEEKGQKTSLEALWLLDRAKARLAYFLRSLMELSSSFLFDVTTAQGNWEIEDQDDLEVFLDELAGFSFLSPQSEPIVTKGAGDMYVFSTACDIGLPGFILMNNPRPITVFIIQPSEKIAVNPEVEILCLNDFTFNGCEPDLRWFAGSKVKPLGVQASKIEPFYARVKL
jgi:hypothetical protein